MGIYTNLTMINTGHSKFTGKTSKVFRVDIIN